ncbi:hypothetical protein ACWEKT_21045 [Nocardia takedensis]
MATFIEAGDIGDAWLQAAQALIAARGRQLVHLAVSIAEPWNEDRGIRGELELALAQHAKRNRGQKVHSVHTVANTIFPISMYNPAHADSAKLFFERARTASRLHAGHKNEWGTYFGRLVAYPHPNDGTETNQLEKFLEVLAEDKNWTDRYEAPLTLPGEAAANPPATDVSAGVTADALVIGPEDRRVRGGPCLAHLSFTSLDGALHLTALYRNHYYLTRAYGNFLGLARLQHFLANESGRQVGGLFVIGTHAKLEDGSMETHRQLLARAERARGDIHRIETSTRPLGSAWSDLELPRPDQTTAGQ